MGNICSCRVFISCCARLLLQTYCTFIYLEGRLTQLLIVIHRDTVSSLCTCSLSMGLHEFKPNCFTISSWMTQHALCFACKLGILRFMCDLIETCTWDGIRRNTYFCNEVFDCKWIVTMYIFVSVVHFFSPPHATLSLHASVFRV